jgi:hypothetical protein
MVGKITDRLFTAPAPLFLLLFNPRSVTLFPGLTDVIRLESAQVTILRRPSYYPASTWLSMEDRQLVAEDVKEGCLIQVQPVLWSQPLVGSPAGYSTRSSSGRRRLRTGTNTFSLFSCHLRIRSRPVCSATPRSIYYIDCLESAKSFPDLLTQVEVTKDTEQSLTKILLTFLQMGVVRTIRTLNELDECCKARRID